MEEVFSRNPDSSELSDGSQFIELRLSDIGPDEEYPSFWVTETLAQWDAASKRIMWDNPQHYSFTTLDEARNWYEKRRQVLAEKGFCYSDMEVSQTIAGCRSWLPSRAASDKDPSNSVVDAEGWIFWIVWGQRVEVYG